MQGFYWLIDGVLAGCPRPGGVREGFRWPWSGGSALDNDLVWLREQGIGAILSLTETSLASETVTHHGLEWLHLPVDDLHPPSPAQLLQALTFIDRHRARGRAVAVHCRMGQGRTGTVLAAFLIRGGSDPVAAVQAVRAVCPGAIGTAVQEEALTAFAARRDWII